MNLKNIINLSAVFSIYVINKLKDGLLGWEIVSVSVNNHGCVISNFKSITSVSVPRASWFSNG
jgi:hypothetical protein